MPLSVLAGALASALLGAGLARALPAEAGDTLPLSEVKPGMKGYGLTVFSGTTPERFDVEVIATLHNFRPNQSLVLIKTSSPRLNLTRSVLGMSGSPIYLNGKMMGAYGYGWSFGSEAIAGVTPIQSMLDELARPVPAAILPRGRGPLPSSEARPARPARPVRAFLGPAGGYDLAGHARQLAARAASSLAAPEGSGLARAETPLLLGGMGGVALKLASSLLGPLGLEPLQAGGSTGGPPAEDAPTRYVDGGAVGIELVRGDISAMSLGTVTRVTGDRLVAFGHPMFDGGLANLPAAIGRVHWIMASQNHSFKLGEAARRMGTLVNDRPAAIVVDSSVKAPTFPVHIEFEGVAGAPHPTWDLEVAHDPFIAPSFAAMALGNAAETTTGEKRDLTWRATSRVKVKGYGTVTLVDFAASSGTPLGPDDFVRSRVVRALGALLNNPWESVVIERLDTTVRVAFEREVSTLRGAKVLEPVVDAGAPVRIRLDLEPYQGKAETRVVELPLPRELAGREVEIELAPGYEVERPQPTPDSVAELMATLPNQMFDGESLVASFKLREQGAAFRGRLAARLPPGSLDTLKPSSDSDAPETFAAQVQIPIPMRRFIVGRDTVHVEIRNVLR